MNSSHLKDLKKIAENWILSLCSQGNSKSFYLSLFISLLKTILDPKTNWIEKKTKRGGRLTIWKAKFVSQTYSHGLRRANDMRISCIRTLPAYAVEEGGMSLSRTKTKSCQRAGELLMSSGCRIFTGLNMQRRREFMESSRPYQARLCIDAFRLPDSWEQRVKSSRRLFCYMEPKAPIWWLRYKRRQETRGSKSCSELSHAGDERPRCVASRSSGHPGLMIVIN